MKNNKKAFLLLELLVAIALISTVFVTLFFLQSKLLQIKQDGIMKVRATYYAQEAFEALRYLRATGGWSTISSPTTGATDYYATFASNTWSLSTTPPAALDGIFTRSIRFSPVYRQGDQQGVIITGPSGYDDPGTRKVTVMVSWDNGSKNIVLDTYLTDWTSNL
ncbi:MAG: prepilin-type N-terminal cleavage/methylation domain-containing protein [Patescibacteria group bacterium]